MCVCCNYHGFFVNGRNVARNLMHICYLFLVNHSVFIVIIISYIFADIVCSWRHRLFLHVFRKKNLSVPSLLYFKQHYYYIPPSPCINLEERFCFEAAMYAIYEWLCELFAGFCSTAMDASSRQKDIFFIGWFFLFHLVMVSYLVLLWMEWS